MKTLMLKLEEFLGLGGIPKDITLLAISGIALLCSIFLPHDILPFDLAWAAVILCGVPIVLEAVIGLVTAFDIKADVLVSLALIASLYIGEYFAAGEIAFIMQLGALLEDLTVAKSRAGTEKLVRLTPQTARVILHQQESIVKAEEVKVGDMIRVLPGETVAVDGVIIKGTSSINQATLTGESMPVDKTVGDEVFSGSVNRFGAFDMRATKVGSDSSVQTMIRLVQSASADKAKIVRLADSWATWIVVTALTAAVLTYFITGQIIRAVTILVVFCPCALVLATPTAIVAAIGNATKHGFLVRTGDALERLSEVNTVAFDKTGTLTYGQPEVVGVYSFGKLSEERIFALAAAAEQLSEHPLGKAVTAGYRSRYDKPLPECQNFVMSVGKGVCADISNMRVLAGNQALLKDFDIDTNGCLTDGIGHASGTKIFIAVNDKPEGLLILADTLRDEAKPLTASLQSQKMRTVILTGDDKQTAETIAAQLNIEEVYAKCLPQDKLDIIGQIQKNGGKVCMLGDGINDAAALKKASVGMAMGKAGSDIAIDAADIALVNDEIQQLPHLLALSKRMMRTIKINLTFSMALNFAAIILAMTGVMGPVIGALVHNAGSVAVIINAAFLLKWRYKK